jgi:hypothetical protein
MAILIRGKARGGLRDYDSAGTDPGHARIMKPMGHNYQHKTVKEYRQLAEKCRETSSQSLSGNRAKKAAGGVGHFLPAKHRGGRGIVTKSGYPAPLVPYAQIGFLFTVAS